MNETKKEYRYSLAPKGKRFLAFIMDIAIFTTLMLLIRELVIPMAARWIHLDLETADIVTSERFYLAVDCILGLPMAIVVYLIPALIFKNGQTLGKKLMGLIVIRKNGEPLRLVNLLFRVIVGFWIFEYVTSLYTYFAFIGMSAVFALVNKKSMAIHDIIAGTLVVEKDKILVDVLVPKVEPMEEQPLSADEIKDTTK